ncbi:lasso peptide biosynthesis B2 protein [Cereibacter changlensis]|uniref:lasso peptide biosynthesis B2 protein n=1 Tax=Cereibacter changlensis TaxID=402884 RepID=UPI00403376BF
MRGLSRLRRLSRRQLGVLALAWITVARVRVALWRQQADAVRAGIAALDAAQPVPIGDLREVVWSVRAAARLMPGATCLTQALSGQYLLARRGYVSTVRLSLPRAERSKLKPHAWLMAGETIALGGSSATYAAHRPFLDYLPGDRRSGLIHRAPEVLQ